MNRRSFVQTISTIIIHLFLPFKLFAKNTKKPSKSWKPAVFIDCTRCTGCWCCVAVCPTKILKQDTSGSCPNVTEGSCIACGNCVCPCPYEAITVRNSYGHFVLCNE